MILHTIPCTICCQRCLAILFLMKNLPRCVDAQVSDDELDPYLACMQIGHSIVGGIGSVI
jgi:hypothetical protein